MQCAHTALVAFTTCRNTLYGPPRLGFDFAVQFVTLFVFFFPNFVAPCFKRIKALQTAYERKAEKLRDYLAENMKTAGIHEIKAADGSFVVKLYLDRDESVVIEDGAFFVPELCNDPKPPEPSKTKIKNAILAGEPVAGAYIVRKDRLTIK